MKRFLFYILFFVGITGQAQNWIKLTVASKIEVKFPTIPEIITQEMITHCQTSNKDYVVSAKFSPDGKMVSTILKVFSLLHNCVTF